MALMEHPADTRHSGHDLGARAYHLITVENENDGRRITIMASAAERIADLIDEVYSRLGRGRFDGDRLRWESDHEDVASFSELTLGEYFELGNCPRLSWTFVGATGGDSA
jgi:hypothetical protein